MRTRKDDGHSSTGLVPTTKLAREGVDPDGGTDRRPLHRGGSAFAPGRSGILGCRFGGHFHNDNAVGVLRDVPGVVIASPARPDDAATMLRTCVAAAKADGSVCRFLEPIVLYHTRDLHATGDGGWLAPYPEPSGWSAAHVPLCSGRTHGE